MSYMDIVSIICIIIIVLIFLVLIESYRECRKFRLTHYNICTDKLAPDTSFRVIMLADLHNTDFGAGNNKLIELIESEKPDVIVLAGDMLVCRRGQEKACMRTADFVSRLSECAEVYYGVGNHEMGVINRTHNVEDVWEEYYERLHVGHGSRIHFMRDESIPLNIDGNKIIIHGLELERDYYKRFVVKRLERDVIISHLGEAENDVYNILIAHNPDYFEQYAEWGADLILSGHNHGGLVRLPMLGGVVSPRLRLFPKYDHGLYKKNTSDMILTNGLGAHSIKIRVNNIPEVVCIDISGTAE